MNNKINVFMYLIMFTILLFFHFQATARVTTGQSEHSKSRNNHRSGKWVNSYKSK